MLFNHTIVIVLATVLLLWLIISFFASQFLVWYNSPINRLKLSSKFSGLLDEIWNPDHDNIKNVTKALFLDPKNEDFSFEVENENIIQTEGKTILYIAADYGYLNLIKKIINNFNGIDIEKDFLSNVGQNANKESFIGRACANGDVDAVKTILECLSKLDQDPKSSKCWKLFKGCTSSEMSESMIELESHDIEEGTINDHYDEADDDKIRDFFFRGLTSEDIPPIVAAQNPVFQHLVEIGL